MATTKTFENTALAYFECWRQAQRCAAPFRPRELARGGDHAGADRGVGRRVDQDEATGAPVGAVGVDRERCARAQRDASDVVELERLRIGLLEAVDVDAVVQRLDDRGRAARGVLDRVAPAGPQRRSVEPANVGVELARDDGRLARAGDQLAARNVELVLEAQRDRQRRDRLLELAVVGVDRRDARAMARGQHDDLLARTQRAARELAGIAPVLAV